MARNPIVMVRVLLPVLLLLVGGCSAPTSSVQPIGDAVAATSAMAVNGEAGDTTPAMQDANPCARMPAMAELMGRYRVVSFERFRGGLTSREEAAARVGTEVLLSTAEFKLGGKTVASPKYDLVCHHFSREESEVPTDEERLLSTFHGYGTDRQVVWELEISASQGDFYYAFEVVRGDGRTELWDLSDGWIYFMHPVADE